MGKMSSDLMAVSKKIAVIRHVGIRKTKLISSPIQKVDLSITENQNLSEDKGLDDFSDPSGVTSTVSSNVEENKQELTVESSTLETT